MVIDTGELITKSPFINIIFAMVFGIKIKHKKRPDFNQTNVDVQPNVSEAICKQVLKTG